MVLANRLAYSWDKPCKYQIGSENPFCYLPQSYASWQASSFGHLVLRLELIGEPGFKTRICFI